MNTAMDTRIIEEFLKAVKLRYPSVEGSRHADEDLLAAFDSELASIAQDHPDDDRPLSQIRYHRNSYAKLNLLPIEILQTIFRLAGRSVEGCGETMEVLRISWTCSYWRTLALGDPQLWRYIDLRSTDLGRLFIERSKPYTLVMDIHREWYCGAQVDERRSSLCKDNLERLGALYFQPLSSTLPIWALERPAPRLQELTVVNYYRFKNIYTSLFNNQTRLRHLELMGCRLAWRSGMYQNLTKLKLEFYGLLPHPEKDKDLLALFRDSPHMKCLELKIMDDKQTPWDPLSNFLLPTTLYSETDHKQIGMLDLREIILDLPAEYMLHILQSIILPGDMTRLDLTARADNDWLTSMLVGKRCLPTELFRDLRDLSVIHNHRYDDIITCGIHGTGLRTSGERYDLSVTFFPLRKDTLPMKLEPVVSTIRNEHPMPFVEHLQFVESSRIGNEERWVAAQAVVSLLAHCGKSLTRLSLHGCGGALLDCIHRRAVEMAKGAVLHASSREPLENLASLAVDSMELSAEDFAHLVSLCELLSPHLSKVQIKHVACTARSRASAADLIGRFQKVGLSNASLSGIDIWCEKEERRFDVQSICAEA